MTSAPQKTALLIAGPTASGKSALAVAQAQQRGGVVINADSMQVYRELSVITARPSAAEQALVPHRLYGHISGAEHYSVGRWLAEAKSEMQACWDVGLVPIICGGTGLYFRALEQGLAETPPIDDAVKNRWRNFQGDLHAALAQLDREAAARLNPADRQRILRALEVVTATGRTLAHWHEAAQQSNFLKHIKVERIYVNAPREELYARAERRFDMMMEQGAMDEVKALPHFDARQPIMKAIGVRQLQAVLREDMPRQQAIIDAKTETRHYIKRQLTWWRGQMHNWHTPTP